MKLLKVSNTGSDVTKSFCFLLSQILIFNLIFLLPSQGIGSTTEAIIKLQPRISVKRASNLAGYINFYSRASKIDPLLVVAITHRESAFSYAVQIGKKRGPSPHNCTGLMQIYPWGIAHKLGGYCNLRNADCNIRTGLIWLEYIRSICSDSTWQWIAAYGLNHCPSYWKARKNRATRRARKLYCRVNENCNKLWPLSRKEN